MATVRKTTVPKNAKQPTAAAAIALESSAHLVERDYIVQDSLHLDGKAYQVGDPITLTDDQAESLPTGIVLAAEE